MLDRHGLQLSRSMTIKTNAPAAAAFAVALAALLVAAWFVYRSGITGAFLLDDFSNLDALGAWGPVTHWDAFWRYLTSGTADPAGRPLSLLSFLLDAQNWPASATPFKVTNILLHLLNGVLLCWAMLKLARRRGIEEPRAAMAALIGAGIWLLHPLFVSTTLYVVQREAMLPATFTFIGIICWCAGRDAFDGGKTGGGIVWMVTGAWLCTLLAMLCKGNGILLPLFLLAAEATVLRTPQDGFAGSGRTHRFTSIVLLGLPIAALAAYLAYSVPGAVRIAASDRAWTIGQRLLSEPRVLTDYLYLLWVPHTTSFGIFNDAVGASTGWLQPWSTLPCAIFILGLVAFGFWARRRFPVLAFAILFYFAGQVLESSFIPLDLAFEHRNYLPAAFMFWPVGVWLSAPKTRPLIGRAVAVAALCLLAVMTWTRAGVWGNVPLQARLWGRINPESPQAQSFSASVEAASGNLPAAITRMRDAAARMPEQPQIALTLVRMECGAGEVNSRTWQRAMYALQHTSSGWNNIANWFLTTLPDASSHACRGLSIAQMEQALTNVKSNPKLPRSNRADWAFGRVDGALAIASDQPEKALAKFDRVLALSPSPDSALQQARALGSAGYPKLALRHLDYFATLPMPPKAGLGMPRIHAWVLHEQGWWPQEMAYLRKDLTADAATKAKSRGADSASLAR